MNDPLDRRRRAAFTRQFVQPAFANHALQDAPPSKTWHLRGASSAYSFTVVWTPFRLSISGDIGSCAYEGCTFFRHWAEAAEAVTDCDLEYLTGKSGIRPVYDRAETLRQLVYQANEGARDFRKGERAERRNYRRMVAEERAAGEYSAGAESESFEQYNPDYPPVIRERLLSLAGLALPQEPRRFDVPDGWELWHRIEQTRGYYHDGLNDIFTPAGRRRLKQDIAARLETVEQAADLSFAIGFDEPLICENLPTSAVWFFKAIQIWARLVCQTAEFETAIAERHVLIAAEARRRDWISRNWRRCNAYNQTEQAIADDDGMGQIRVSAA